MLATCIVVLGTVFLAGAAEPAKDVPAKMGTTLTDDSLGTMLEGTGLNSKIGKFPDGKPYYFVEISHAGVNMTARVDISSNNRVIWLTLNLGELPESAPAEPIINLLRRNGYESGKAMFTVSGKNLLLRQPFDNHDMTPARMLTEMHEICGVARSLSKDYDFKTWKPAAPPAPAPK
jgi:hypothetical protein